MTKYTKCCIQSKTTHNILYVIGFSVKCTYCSHSDTRVVDSRETLELEVTRRRRECEKCKKRFTTYERVETENILVQKCDGTRQAFDRNKIKRGITHACEKRSISAGNIEKVVQKIESRIRSRGRNEVTSKAIGELVMKHLKRLDDVAYIRFASVYRQFTDVASFENEIKALQE